MAHNLVDHGGEGMAEGTEGRAEGTEGNGRQQATAHQQSRKQGIDRKWAQAIKPQSLSSVAHFLQGSNPLQVSQPPETGPPAVDC